MLNLRFRYVFVTSFFHMLLYVIPKANYMIKHTEKYTEEKRFEYACDIMDYVRRRSRTTTEVYGMENIPENETVIFYSNHQGKYDALGILLALKKPCGVLWEKKQAKRLLSRQVCALIEGEAIDLEDMREKTKAIMNVLEKVKNGKNMLVFPEGGYEDNHNELRDFFSGCFHCSLRSRTTIVPIAIYDSYKALNSNTFEKVTTQVHFLKPIPFEEYGHMTKAEIAALVKQRISEKLDEIKKADR